MSLDAAISTLVARLEQVTQRLEGVEKQLASGPQGGAASAAPSSGGASASGEDAPSVTEYEALINQFIKPYVDHSNKLGAEDVAKQAALVLEAVNRQRDMLRVAATSKKPSDDVFAKLLQPTSEVLGQISAIKDAGRTSKFFNNLSAVAEGIPALGWVCVSPTPGPHVADMRGGSEFYSNRILKEFKGVNQTQVDWVAAFNGFLKELQVYVKKYHTTGLTWNPRGGDASAAAASAPAAPASSGGAPPPPPGPAPPPPAPLVTSSSGGNAPDMANVFAALSKGEDVTKGLRKVTNDMKAKNRTDKSSVVPAAAVSSAPKTTSAAKQEVTKPPKFTLEGTKWVVEYQVGNKSIVISETEAKQTVYIYKCRDSVVQIKGKVNAIILDDCTKTAVVFDTAIATFEVVNCKSVEVQITQRVPSVAIDKTSGCQVYLSKDNLDVEIVTSKSDTLNVLLPTADGDYEEKNIPEQYKTVVRNGGLFTDVVSHF